MVSKEYIQKKLSYDISKMNIDNIGMYASEHRHFIDRLYGEKSIDDTFLDTMFESVVILKGLNEYDRIVSSLHKRRPLFIHDSSLHPKCIIYAWQHGHITDRQFIQIPLDHNYGMATIANRYDTSNMIADIRKLFLTVPAKPVLDTAKKTYQFFADPE